MSLEQFKNQQYINMETFRKNGQGVKTPVWFAQDGDALFVWTETTAGKAKRIRRDGKVNIVPSKADGTPVGDWVAANAVASDAPEAVAHVKALFVKKYGFVFYLFRLMGILRRAKYASVNIQVAG